MIFAKHKQWLGLAIPGQMVRMLIIIFRLSRVASFLLLHHLQRFTEPHILMSSGSIYPTCFTMIHVLACTMEFVRRPWAIYRLIILRISLIEVIYAAGTYSTFKASASVIIGHGHFGKVEPGNARYL